MFVLIARIEKLNGIKMVIDEFILLSLYSGNGYKKVECRIPCLHIMGNS